jgi:uncharacterized protein with NRDE domain
VCTLAVYHRVFAARPLVVAANRDEYLDRAAAPPTLLRTATPRAVGGRDLVAGGTWLGFGETGLVAGLLNRRSGTPPDPACRSRGLLCLDVLACRTAEEAAARVAAEPAGRYNPFNLLVADGRDAFVAVQGVGDAPAVTRLPPGLHLLTNLEVNDPTCPRIAASHGKFRDAGDAFARDADETAFVARLRTVLADHETALDPRGPGGLCVHVDGFGTRCSTVLLVASEGWGARSFYADGPPCRAALVEVGLPF